MANETYTLEAVLMATDKGLSKTIKQAEDSIDSMDKKFDGAYQDKNGRWRDANGKFIKMKEQANQTGNSFDKLGGKYDDIYQDKNGRWRNAQGNLIKASEQASQTGKEFRNMGDEARKTGEKFNESAEQPKKFNNAVMDIAKSVGVFKAVEMGVGLVSSSVSGAIKRVDTLNNSNKVFENMGFAVSDTDKMMKNLQASIKGLPTPLNDAVQGVQLISASTKDLDKSEKIFASLNNAILGFGGSSIEVERTTMELSHAFSSGKINGQVWNSMMVNNLGPTLNAMAEKMGITTHELQEGLSKGSISVEEFQDALIDLNEKGGGGLNSLQQIAKDATGGLETGLANMKTAVVRGVGNIIQSLNDSLSDAGLGGIGDIISSIGTGLEGLLNKAAVVIPPIINGLGSILSLLKPIAPLIGGILIYFTTYQAVMGGISIAFKAWDLSIKLVEGSMALLNAVMNANPIGLIITTILVLVGTFMYLWNTCEEFRVFWSGIWDSIKEVVNGVAEWLTQTWDVIVNAMKIAWDGITAVATSVFNGILEIFEPIGEWFTGLWNSVCDVFLAGWDLIKTLTMGPVLLLIDLITGNFKKFKEDTVNLVTHLVNDVWRLLVGAFDMTIGAFLGLTGSILDSVINFGAKMLGWFGQALGSLGNWLGDIGSSVREGLSSLWHNITSWFDKLGSINLLDAGKAIMDSFLKGLKHVWEDVKEFVGGIGDWIREHKGPISYDKVLLIKNGQAVMQGLNNGLQTGFESVKDTVTGMADELDTAFTLSAGFDDINKEIDRTINHEIKSDKPKKPAVFNINLGNDNFKAFVDDISNAMGNQVDVNLSF